MFRTGKTWISSAHQGVVNGNIAPNTLAACRLAAEKGADMIETDARTTADGVLIAHHDAVIRGFSSDGEPISLPISETEYAVIARAFLTDDGNPENRVPTLKQTLNLAYFYGMCVNIDLKEWFAAAERVAETVAECGMRGRVVYATNGSGVPSIEAILRIDPEARFIDTKRNFTAENLAPVVGYPSKCYVYTSDFSDENIAEIRASGCRLATISLNERNVFDAFRHFPDMAEYPHTSDFEALDAAVKQGFLSRFRNERIPKTEIE